MSKLHSDADKQEEAHIKALALQTQSGRYRSFYVFLVLCAAGPVVMTLGLFAPTSALLVTRELGMATQHLAGIEGVKNMFGMTSLALGPALFKRAPLLGLLAMAHAVRLVSFGVYAHAVQVGAVATNTGTALVLLYAANSARSTMTFAVTMPGYYLGTVVPKAERGQLNALGSACQRVLVLAGPLVGSGLAAVAPTRMLAAAYPAWFMVGVSCCMLVAVGLWVACRGMGPPGAAEAVPSTNAADDLIPASHSAHASSSDAVAVAPATGTAAPAADIAARAAPQLSDHAKYLALLVWGILIGGIGGSLFFSVLSLVLWDSYGLDSAWQFILFS